MVTIKSAPDAHSLADAAAMPPAACSLCIASALQLRETLACALSRRRSPEVEPTHGKTALREISSHGAAPAHKRQTLRHAASGTAGTDMFPSPMKPTLLCARVTVLHGCAANNSAPRTFWPRLRSGGRGQQAR